MELHLHSLVAVGVDGFAQPHNEGGLHAGDGRARVQAHIGQGGAQAVVLHIDHAHRQRQRLGLQLALVERAGVVLLRVGGALDAQLVQLQLSEQAQHLRLVIGPQVVAGAVLSTQDDQLVARGVAAVVHRVVHQREVGGRGGGAHRSRGLPLAAAGVQRFHLALEQAFALRAVLVGIRTGHVSGTEVVQALRQVLAGLLLRAAQISISKIHSH